jgi:hypothetical protein
LGQICQLLMAASEARTPKLAGCVMAKTFLVVA